MREFSIMNRNGDVFAIKRGDQTLIISTQKPLTTEKKNLHTGMEKALKATNIIMGGGGGTNREPHLCCFCNNHLCIPGNKPNSNKHTGGWHIFLHNAKFVRQCTLVAQIGFSYIYSQSNIKNKKKNLPIEMAVALNQCLKICIGKCRILITNFSIITHIHTHIFSDIINCNGI